METNNDSKETQQIEKKQSAEMNNKNKLYNFLNKRKISSENKDTQDQLLESSINLNNNKPYQNNANYLNTLLKKSFYDTINNNSTSNTSPSKQSKEKILKKMN